MIEIPDLVDAGDLEESQRKPAKEAIYRRMSAEVNEIGFVRLLSSGRGYVLPSDVKFIATDVLHHRLVRTLRAEVENVETDEIVAEVLRHTAIP